MKKYLLWGLVAVVAYEFYIQSQANAATAQQQQSASTILGASQFFGLVSGLGL